MVLVKASILHQRCPSPRSKLSYEEVNPNYHRMFKFLIFWVFLSNLTLSLAQSTAQEEAVSKAVPTPTQELVFSIEHSFGGAFTHRTSVKVVTKADGKQSLVYPERNGVVGEDIDGFKTLLANKGLYRIKIRSSGGTESESSIVTSIPAVCVSFDLTVCSI